MFDRLVDNELPEVERRVPDYFVRFGLTVPDLARTAEETAGPARAASFDATEGP